MSRLTTSIACCWAASSSAPGSGVVDEHDVGVGAVPLLAAAQPAHPDDEQAGERRGAGGPLDLEHALLEGDLQQRGGEVGHRPAHVVEAEPAGEVGDGDAEQLGAPDGAGREHRGLGVVLAAGGRAHPAQHVLARARVQAAGVAEELHALGGLLEQVGGEAAAGQGVRELLGRRPLVAEQPEVPVGGPELVADPAEGEQAGVGVGLVGEPAEHHGQQLALDGRAPAHAVGERLEVAQGARRVAEAERREPLAGGLGREPDVLLGEPGHGREQRPVEDPLVQPAHLAAVGAPLGDHRLLRRGAVAEGAAEPAQVGPGGRHQVGAAQAVQLDAVLERAQVPVGLGEGRGVVAADVPAGGERGQAVERARGPQRLVGPPVHELEQLHRELDVAQAARGRA